jgi:hypothetical protein
LIAGRITAAATIPGPVDFEVAAGLTLQAWAMHAPHGNESHVAIRTAYIDMSSGTPGGTANRALGMIRQRLFHGDFIQYIVHWPGGELTVRRPPTELFDEGAAVTLSFAREHCILLEG